MRPTLASPQLPFCSKSYAIAPRRRPHRAVSPPSRSVVTSLSSLPTLSSRPPQGSVKQICVSTIFPCVDECISLFCCCYDRPPKVPKYILHDEAATATTDLCPLLLLRRARLRAELRGDRALRYPELRAELHHQWSDGGGLRRHRLWLPVPKDGRALRRRRWMRVGGMSVGKLPGRH